MLLTSVHKMCVYVAVSLENVSVDIAELERGMELTRREYDARLAAKDREPPLILSDFLANSDDKMRKLKADLKSAQVRASCYAASDWLIDKGVV